MPDVVIGCLGANMRRLKSRWGVTGSDDTRMFLLAADPKSDSDVADWWRGLRRNAKREMFQEKKAAGEVMDKSSEPVYSLHIQVYIDIALTSYPSVCIYLYVSICTYLLILH